MNKKKIKQIISRLQLGDFISIHTVEAPNAAIFGIVAKKSDEFIIVKQFYRFIYAGILIIHIDHLLNIENENNDAYHQVIKQMPIKNTAFLHSKAFDPCLIDIDGYTNLFTTIKALHPLINLSGAMEETDYFKTGLIEKITPNAVFLKTFDVNGIWQKDLFKANYDEITEIEVGDSYSETLYLYTQLKQ